MNREKTNSYLEQAKIGRRKLRQGSLMVLFTLTLDALISLYFVSTAKPEVPRFGLSPTLFAIFLFVSLPVMGMGIHLMAKGFRMETKGYTDDLKESEKKLREIIAKTNKTI